MNIVVAGEELQFFSERALYWPAKKFLLLSDVHLGKPESLQAVGIPVPSGAHKDDLACIDRLLAQVPAESVFILGDMIHNRQSWTADIQRDLHDYFSERDHIHWHLLIGNHERGSKQHLQKLPIDLIEGDLAVEPFLFSHGHDLDQADSKSAYFVIQGHVHPVIKLHKGAIRLRLPCFVLDRERLTLPSFGSMTGGYEISRSRGRRIFAATNEIVFEIPSNDTHRRGADQ